jgi:hypothetical protein
MTMEMDKSGSSFRQASLQTNLLKVVSPVGETTVEEITMAPRLDNLEGKTICLIWNSAFKSNVTLSVIADLLKNQYPTAKVIPYTEMPPSAKAPAPGTTSPEQIALVDSLKKNGCHAVISGNGG